MDGINISSEQLAWLRKRYPSGTRLVLIEMVDSQAPPVGIRGTVIGVDDAGQLQMRWDTGGRLSLVHGVDKFRFDVGK